MAEKETKIKVIGVPELFMVDGPSAQFQCPGCQYGVIQRLVLEALAEMELNGRAIGNAGAGCASQFFLPLNIDNSMGAHGRPPDVATGIKRVAPDKFVFTVQGDGDAIAIGTEPLIQAAARGERITVIMANNGGYGMTGGQMAPTTLVDQVTTTSPGGRDARLHGYPIRVPELLATLDGVVYSARGMVHTPAHYQRTRKYIRTAFQKQVDDLGFSFVEIISSCPTNWHLTPVESMKWIEERIVPAFPPGEFKDLKSPVVPGAAA